MTITQLQQNQLTNLLANLQKFEEKYGKITNLIIMSNPIEPKALFTLVAATQRLPQRLQ